MTIPEDIYRDSGSRLPFPVREELDDIGKKMFDQALDSGNKTAAGLRGPIGILLHSSQVARCHGELFRYLTFESGISSLIRELAILVTAREMDSKYEWAAHEPFALKAGVTQEIVNIIKYRKSYSELPETEASVIQLGREMFGKREVSSETFSQAIKIFGKKGLVDLVALMAHYCATAAILCAFDKQVGPDEPQLP